MLNAFDDVRLPIDIERGTQGGPVFNTTVRKLTSGKEKRNAEWSAPINAFNIGYGISNRADLEAVYAFFHARRGRARGFRFRNWLDYEVKAGVVGNIAGEPTKRQLVRIYEDTTNTYIRSVTRPVAATVKVWVNGVISTAYTLDPLGVLEFPSDPGENVLASFEFDYPVRFDTDQLTVQLEHVNAGLVPNIPLVELKE